MEYQVSCVLALSCALGTGDLVSGERIHTLAAEHRVPVKAGQCIGYILLIPDAVAAVLRFTVDGVAGDAEDLFPDQRHIVAACTVACRHGRSHIAHLPVAGVDAVVFEYQRLMTVFLRTQCTAYIRSDIHTFSTLIVDAQHGRHTVAAAARFQCRGNTLTVSDAARAGSRTGGETRHERLHLQVGGSHQRTGSTAKVDAFVPLVDMVRLDEPQLRQRHQIYHPQSALHLQRQMQRRRQHLSALPRPTEDAQAGFPAQKVFSMRMGLQDLPQGRSSFDSGAHPSIERRGLANIGRQYLPIWLPQNIAIPRGDLQEHEFLVHQFRAFPPGRSESPRPSAFRWRRLPGRFPST